MFEELYYEALESSVRYPNTSKSVRKTRLHFGFPTYLLVFGYLDETLFLVFDRLLENKLFLKKLSKLNVQTLFLILQHEPYTFVPTEGEINTKM